MQQSLISQPQIQLFLCEALAEAVELHVVVGHAAALGPVTVHPRHGAGKRQLFSLPAVPPLGLGAHSDRCLKQGAAGLGAQQQGVVRHLGQTPRRREDPLPGC